MGRGGQQCPGQYPHPRQLQSWDEVAAALDRQAGTFNEGASASSVVLSDTAHIVLAEAAAKLTGDLKADAEAMRQGASFDETGVFRLVVPTGFAASYSAETVQRFADLVKPVAEKLDKWPQVNPLETMAEKLVAHYVLGGAIYFTYSGFLPLSEADAPENRQAVQDELHEVREVAEDSDFFKLLGYHEIGGPDPEQAPAHLQPDTWFEPLPTPWR